MILVSQIQSLTFLKAENVSWRWSERDVPIEGGSEKCSSTCFEDAGRGP